MTSLRTSVVRAVLIGSSALYLVLPTAAAAQDASPPSPTTPGPAGARSDVPHDTDTIVVTGSRIQRRDYEANSPIVTANRELLENSSTGAIETNLNKLPAFTPVQTPSLGGDIQSTATNTPGAATISLRNLGTNRNLVLVDGRRTTPANALNVVDINTIPAAAVDRVEIITGGASATYGADAVGGVVNFILKKNFEGLQLDAQAGISQRGDGREYIISGLMGANFDDGRGNVTIGLAVNDREAAKRIDRPWFRKALRDPRFTGTEFFPDFSAFQSYGSVNPSQAAVNSLFGNSVVANSARIYFNRDGTAFTGFFQSPPGGAFRFKEDLTGIKWSKTGDGALKQNFLDDLLQLPLNRYNIYARGNYEIADWVSAFATATFTRVRTNTLQQPSPSVNGWSAIVPASNPVPAELRTLLDSRILPVPTSTTPAGIVAYNSLYYDTLQCDRAAVPGAPGSGASCNWQLTYYLNYADRAARTDVLTYNILAGLNGKIPGTSWTWEFYGSQGESETNSLITGTASLERFRSVVSSPNWGKGFSAQGNPLFGGFGASSATCTSGFDPFNKGDLSRDCIEAVAADLKNRAVMAQSVWEFNAQGGLFKLPGGELRGAIGASHRRNRYEYLNDTLTTQGRSYLDQTIGIYPSGNSSGTIKADEVYGELLVPIIGDLPAVKKFELELGARHSHYNTTGNAFTWKALGDWEVTDWLRVRGGFNKAVRAPNVAELFLAPQQSFTAAGGGDVCRTNNTLPYSANPATNPNAANVLAVCKILMDRQIATTSRAFYADPQFYAAVGPAFAFPTLVGNPDVKPEKAKTWTAGAVINSPFKEDMFRRLRLSVDYYNIKVTNAIGPQTLDTAQLQCFSPDYNPAISTSPAQAAASPFCQAIGRVAGDGALGNVQVTYLNSGRFKTSGIDFQLDWVFKLGPGSVSLNSVVSYLISLKSAGLPTVGYTEYVGTLGPAGSAAIAENGLNPGAFRWKMLNTFGYSIGPVAASLQWQHQPAAKSIAYPSSHNTPFVGSPSYDLFNLAATVGVTERASLRVGVDNLFDRRPPLTEYNPTGALANSIGGNPFNSYFFDLNGRRFYVGANFKL